MTTPPTSPPATRSRRRTATMWLAAAVTLIAAGLGVGACALAAEPADRVLTEGTEPAATAALEELPLGERAAALQREIDAESRSLLAVSEAEPDDLDAALAAARSLFSAADLRMQRASLGWLQEQTDVALAQLLAVDEQVDDAVRSEVVSLCTAGLAAADRAAEARPESAEARLHQALHLSLIAWANGPARALLSGYGPRLVSAIDTVIELDAEHDGGAPLRLQGRFRSRAPWPYGDEDMAIEALQRATELAANPVGQLFLGDALWAANRRDEARAAWRAATTANADASTRWSADLMREFARRRLALTDA